MILGSVVGGYRILGLVGEGGMGTVFRAVDVLLEREVALKLLRPELTHEPDLVKRFRTEAVALARLNHPHIVTLHHLFRDGDQYFMVLEFVQGETIDKLIARCSPLPWQTAAPLICQSLNGLEHAHILKVVHRDIKPSNLILTQQSTVKIMDFGIARMLETDGVTQAGNILGTVKYMPPEQILGQEIDFRADIYGMGAVLYEMVTGKPPFDKRTDYELIRTKVEEMPEPPRKRAPNIPRRLDAAILKALARHPDDRYQSAGAFRDELEAILAEPFCDEEDDNSSAAETPVRASASASPQPRAGTAVAVTTPEIAQIESTAAEEAHDQTLTEGLALLGTDPLPELYPDNWWEDEDGLETATTVPAAADSDETRTGAEQADKLAFRGTEVTRSAPIKPIGSAAPQWNSIDIPMDEPEPFWKKHPRTAGLGLLAAVTAISFWIGFSPGTAPMAEPEMPIAAVTEPLPAVSEEAEAGVNSPVPQPSAADLVEPDPMAQKPVEPAVIAAAEPEPANPAPPAIAEPKSEPPAPAAAEEVETRLDIAKAEPLTEPAEKPEAAVTREAPPEAAARVERPLAHISDSAVTERRSPKTLKAAKTSKPARHAPAAEPSAPRRIVYASAAKAPPPVHRKHAAKHRRPGSKDGGWAIIAE